MKKLLRHYVLETYILYTTSKIASGMFFGQGLRTLLVTGLAFMATSFLAKPVINILLLPLNMVTFGFFRWVSAAIVLYLVTLIVSSFKIAVFDFPGLSNKWIEIPSLHFEGFMSYIAFAFIISFFSSILYWLFK